MKLLSTLTIIFAFGHWVVLAGLPYLKPAGPVTPVFEVGPTYQPPQPGVEYGDESWTIIGQNGDQYTSNSVLFECRFLTSNTEYLLYKVTWLNDKGHQHPMAMLAADSSQRGLKLNESEYLSAGFHMGDYLSCYVTAYTYGGDAPGPKSLDSESRFIGIQILTPTITLNSEDDSSQNYIKLRPTLPISCRLASTCSVWLTMHIPGNTCSQSVVSNGGCGARLNSWNWFLEIVIPLKTFNKDEYARNRDYYVYLDAKMTDHILWDNYTLPPIKIQIRPKLEVFEGKSCYSHNDPHLKTFDGRKYDNHQDGTFVMYINTKYETEVQMKYRTCRNVNGFLVKCNCGVAVRAGLDLYIVDVCDPAKQRFEFKYCDAYIKSLIVTRQTPKKYQITFNYGTYVSVSLDNIYSSWFLKVCIIPSKNDQDGATRGLCGRMDGDCNNDFHFANDTLAPDNLPCGSPYNRNRFTEQPLSFINSWKIQDLANDMFSDSYNTANTKPLNFSVCRCTGKERYQLNNITTCGAGSVETCTRGYQVGSHSCSINRKRRSVHRHQTVPVLNKYNKDSNWNRNKRQASNHTLTLQEATKVCNDSLLKSDVYSLCAEVPNANPYDSVETCILDLEMTGDVEWAAVNKNNMQDACLTELRRNKTFSEDTPSGRAIKENIDEVACPMSCNSRGTCENGTCVCDDGYGGSDCSLDLARPPQMAGILDSGLCDEYELPCDYAYVFGEVFSDVGSLTCRLQHFNILTSGERTYGSTYYTSAELETLFEARCPLATTRQRREVSSNQTDALVTGYTISISNNGSLFGSGVDLFMYTSECQLVSINGETVYFSVKPGYCYMEGRCLQGGEPHPLENCTFCDTSQSATSWSFVENGKECVLPRDEDKVNESLLIGVCLTAVVFIAIATAAILYFKCYSKGRLQ